jgi:hypothetical protein
MSRVDTIPREGDEEVLFSVGGGYERAGRSDSYVYTDAVSPLLHKFTIEVMKLRDSTNSGKQVELQ